MQFDIFDDDDLLLELWNAYYDARKNKRKTMNIIAFEQNLEPIVSRNCRTVLQTFTLNLFYCT